VFTILAALATVLALLPAPQPASANTTLSSEPATHDHATHQHDQATTDAAPSTCEAQGLQTIWGGFCTHGDDPMPQMLDMSPSELQQEAQIEATTTANAALCDGDGESGNRIQVIYAHPAGSVDSFSYVSWAGAGWALAADGILAESARRKGGNRHFRFVHDENCNPTVLKVELSAAGDDHFGNTILELFQLGFNRSDRRYLVFMESTVLCGVSSVLMDDRPGSENGNNFGVNFGRVDRYCWGGVTAAHEIVHMLGGVQSSAPNSTQGGHCTDEWDIMCYSDPPYYPSMRVVCPDTWLNETMLDCNGDDYFNPRPEPGSYLATHWNVANSGLLIVGPDPPPCPDVTTEPDHDYPAARTFTVGDTERHAFCDQYDYDVVKMLGRAGKTYRIETRNLTAGVDTNLSIYLHDGFGLKYVTFDDNGNGLLASRITYTPTTTELFYVSVTDTNFSFGSDKSFDLRITHPIADTVPPTSTARVLPVPSASGWNRGPVTVELSATDDPGGSGVHSLTWVVDGPWFIPSKTAHGDTGSATITRSGVSTIIWISKDENFNTEALRQQEIRIDRRYPTITAPVAALTTGTRANLTRVPVVVSWTGADIGGSGVARYRLQRSSDAGATWWNVALADPLSTSGRSMVLAGTHLFRVRIIDGAGNPSQWVTGDPPHH